jgi:hypothetical protein
MDRRERYESLQIAVQAAMTGERADLWSAMPGIIESFNPATMTCEVQVSIQVQFTSPEDGSVSWLTIPLCVDCPVIFPSGGGCTLTFPIAQGDECLLIFASRCIDSWWQQGGVQQQSVLRMHDLSDGFVLPGPRSQPRVIPSIFMSGAELRTDDGTSFFRVNSANHNVVMQTSANAYIVTTGDLTGTIGGAANITASGDINLTSSTKIKLVAPLVQVDATTFTVNANSALNGSITQGAGGSGGAAHLIGPVTVDNDLTAASKSVQHHTHNVQNVQGGGSTLPTDQPT